jgi:hypothetical protein
MRKDCRRHDAWEQFSLKCAVCVIGAPTTVSVAEPEGERPRVPSIGGDECSICLNALYTEPCTVLSMSRAFLRSVVVPLWCWFAWLQAPAVRQLPLSLAKYPRACAVGHQRFVVQEPLL